MPTHPSTYQLLLPSLAHLAPVHWPNAVHGGLTPLTRALPEPLTFATVPSLIFASDFCRLTSWVVPNEAEAGRFSPDMLDDDPS